MERKIWKFVLPVTDTPEISMPAGAEVLSAQVQFGSPVIWALLDPDVPEKTRHFTLLGTGNPAPEDLGKFIGTLQLNDGTLVLHLFEAHEPR